MSVKGSGSETVFNIALPYVGEIAGWIQKDEVIFFQGLIPPNGKGFEIDFKMGPSPKDDIAFHFNPRLGQYIALNSFRNGSWETEEHAPDKPFASGERFRIIINVGVDAYEVYVNGFKHSTFKHRAPVTKVSTLAIRGDISQLICGFIDTWSPNSLFRPRPQITITPGATTASTDAPQQVSELLCTSSNITPLKIPHALMNPVLPSVCKIPLSLRRDIPLFLQGYLPTVAKDIVIDFKTGPAANDDIAFHYNLRIGQPTVLNSFRKGVWDTVENAPEKPFAKGEPFQMIIFFNADAYEVYVNGPKHCTFKHRIPLTKVSTLAISGDVSQIMCGFIDNWSSYPPQ